MKILIVICGVLLVALAVSGRSVCEECDEEAPLAVPDDQVPKKVILPVIDLNASSEEDMENVEQVAINIL